MLNGAFGVGKTTLAHALLARHSEWMLFDPEEVGLMLWRLLPGPRGDFQELPSWAPLVVETARALDAAYGRTIVVPMTLIHENYRVVRSGFEAITPTRHFTLVAPRETIAQRLVERGDAPGSWAHEQTERCVVALESSEFKFHLDARRPVENLVADLLRSL